MCWFEKCIAHSLKNVLHIFWQTFLRPVINLYRFSNSMNSACSNIVLVLQQATYPIWLLHRKKKNTCNLFLGNFIMWKLYLCKKSTVIPERCPIRWCTSVPSLWNDTVRAAKNKFCTQREVGMGASYSKLLAFTIQKRVVNKKLVTFEHCEASLLVSISSANIRLEKNWYTCILDAVDFVTPRHTISVQHVGIYAVAPQDT